MKRSLILIALAALICAGIWLISASRASSTDMPGHGRQLAARRGAFFHPAPEEMKKIRGIMTDIHQKDLLLGLEEQKKKIELAEILLKPNPTRAALDGKLNEILAIQKEKQEDLVDAFFKVKKILKPDEQGPFTDMIIHRIIGGPREPDMHPGRPMHGEPGIP